MSASTLSHAARALARYAVNNERARRAIANALGNYQAARARGTYCPAQARKGLLQPVNMAARDYARAYCGSRDYWPYLFGPADRAQAADAIMTQAERFGAWALIKGKDNASY
jgi:hypothetical protein